MTSKSRTTNCPECGSVVTLKRRPHLGQIVICKYCHTRLEVVEELPLELEWAFDEVEDGADYEEELYDEDRF